MCFEERKIESRGRPPPCRAIRWRTRVWRRPKSCFDLLVMARPLLLLAFFAADRLGVVFDALALIGFGLAVGAEHGRDLPDPLPVGAGDGDRGRLLAGDFHVARDREDHVVAVTELKLQVLALHRGAIAYAVDLEIDGETLGDARHHVVGKSARRAPQHAGALGVRFGLDPQLAVLDRRGDLAVDGELERAELALGGQHLPRHLDGDALRDGDRVLADARHHITSEDAAEDFAADIGRARLVIRHDAARRRQDGDAETVIDARQIGDARIDPPARLGDARDLADHRLAIDIFELDLELGHARADLLARISPDIAFALQHFQHIGPDLRGRRTHHRFMRPLTVADA